MKIPGSASYKKQTSNVKNSKSMLHDKQMFNKKKSKFVSQNRNKFHNFVTNKGFLVASLTTVGLGSILYCLHKFCNANDANSGQTTQNHDNESTNLDNHNTGGGNPNTGSESTHNSDHDHNANFINPEPEPDFGWEDRNSFWIRFPYYRFEKISYDGIPDDAILYDKQHDDIKTHEGTPMSWARKINSAYIGDFPNNDGFVPIIETKRTGIGMAIGCHEGCKLLIFDRPDKQYFRPAKLKIEDFNVLVEIFDHEKWLEDNFCMSDVNKVLSCELHRHGIDFEQRWYPASFGWTGGLYYRIGGITNSELEILRDSFEECRSGRKLHKGDDILSPDPGGEFKTTENENFGWSLKLLPDFANKYPNEGGYVHIVNECFEDFEFKLCRLGIDYSSRFILNFLPRPERKYFSFIVFTEHDLHRCRKGNNERILREGEIVCIFDSERWSNDKFGKRINNVIYELKHFRSSDFPERKNSIPDIFPGFRWCNQPAGEELRVCQKIAAEYQRNNQPVL